MRRLATLLLVSACAAEEPIVLPPQEPAVVVLPKPGATASTSGSSSASPAPAETVATTATVSTPPPVPPAATTGLDVPDRDPRLPPRARALVATEVTALERLLAATAATSPDRALLLRRIAEDYVELRKGAVASAGANATKAYDDLLKTFPTATVAGDDALYYDALEHEIAGDGMNARKLYFQLVSTQPSSKWIPFAYFAFGEMFLREAKTDPTKWALAEQAYREVLKYPGNAVLPDALWRSGQAADAQGDTLRAQGLYQKLRQSYPQSPVLQRIGSTP